MTISKVTDLNAPELDIFTKLSEPQLIHIYEPQLGLFIAESKNVISRALEAGYEPVSMLADEDEVDWINSTFSKYDGMQVYITSVDTLKTITGFCMHRGLLCAMRRKENHDFTKLCASFHRIAVLEGVVNPTNVGAIIRSAAALNVEAVILSPDCSDPLSRRASRVSMGTVFQVPWCYLGSTRKEWDETGIKRIKEMGYNTVALALKADSIDIRDDKIKSCDKLAIILGAEGSGLSDNTIDSCDFKAIIPMSNNVDSLNVAAASAVAFWELCQPIA